MSETWLADLMVATVEWVRDCGGMCGVPDLSGHVAALSGAAHELEYFGGEL